DPTPGQPWLRHRRTDPRGARPRPGPRPAGGGRPAVVRPLHRRRGGPERGPCGLPGSQRGNGRRRGPSRRRGVPPHRRTGLLEHDGAGGDRSLRGPCRHPGDRPGDGRLHGAARRRRAAGSPRLDPARRRGRRRARHLPEPAM
ncbi:MAG: hypothetical protein AVDCRST_MAG48-1726, partial [uncultured Friedmanniella sp.]